MKDKLNTKGVLSEGYGIIPKKIMKDKGLTIESKAIYSFLASYTGAGTTAFPGVDMITDRLGISRQRFNKHRKLLEDKGYITIQRKDGGNGKFGSNVYTLEPVPWLQNPTVDNPTMENPTMENVTTINNTSINNTNNNNTNKKDMCDSSNHTTDIETQFEEWWDLYGKKLDRKKSIQKFKIAIKSTSFEEIMEGTRVYLDYLKRETHIDQRHPTTFLNNETYLDKDTYSELAKNKQPDDDDMTEQEYFERYGF